MKRNTMLKILNPIIGVLLVCQLVTGFARGSFSRETFEFVHEGGAILLAALVALHVILNANWIRANYVKRRAAGGGPAAS